jgi:cytochrome c oxidase subunit 1
VVIMYFAIAYAIWPNLTGHEAGTQGAQRLQLWLWFVGMLVMSLPWHWLGLQGQWRRVAQFDYSNPIIAPWGPWVVVSLVGGLLMLASAFLFIRNLLATRVERSESIGRFAFAKAVHEPTRVPATLNGFGFWNVLVLVLMVAAYGWPIAQFFVLQPPHAVVHRVDRGG